MGNGVSCASRNADELYEFPTLDEVNKSTDEYLWIGKSIKFPSALSLESFDDYGIIGTGLTSAVRLVKYKKTKKFYVLKSFSKKILIEKKTVAALFNEKYILKHLSASPFILSLYGTFHTRSSAYMILEYVPGGELFHLLNKYKSLDGNWTKFYAAELILCLEYLHDEKNCIYRDLKLENILIDEQGHIKLIDYGFTKELGIDERCFTCCGTPQYLAPELLSPNLKTKGYTKSIDIWALACVIYELVVGKTPFINETNDTAYEIYSRIIQGKVKWPKPINSQLKDLLSKMLEVEYTKRLTKINEIKAHKWFANVDWDKFNKKLVRPPYLPTLRIEGDRSNFEEFKETDCDVNDNVSEIYNKEFEGF